ncbi:hypothetical protein M3Y99_00775000 [Aphelenchoides fujianensis]|nr:hypothetical protein M3Y99_00775000 [Aphelenchoides fujianensis]
MQRLLGFLLLAALGVSLAVAQWPRWEERTLDCSNVAKTDQCVLLAPKSKIPRDPANYRCRREPMPQQEWNTLVPKDSTRLVCPIACEPDADLSVIQKKPIDLKGCKKYFTYGKLRDEKANEWFLWIAEPCLAANVTTLTTHCRYKDIPIHPEGKLEQELASRS